MLAPTWLLIPPPQGSVLGRIVTGQSCLEILYILEAEAFLASVRAEIAALRAAQPVCDYLSIHLLTLNQDNCLHGIREQWCALCENRESDPPQRNEVVFKPKSRKENDVFDCRGCHVSSPEELAAFFGDLERKLVHREVVCQTNDVSEELSYTVTELCTDEQIAAWYPHTKGGVANSSSILRSFYRVTDEPEPSEQRFAALPVKPWVDSRRETFHSLFGKLLESTQEETANRRLPTKYNLPAISPRKKAAAAPEKSLLCTICKDYRHQVHEHVPVLTFSFAQQNIDRVKKVVEKWQQVLDSVPVCTNQGSKVAMVEKQLTCAKRRYITVYRMLRRGTISKSAFEDTKEHYARLLREEQPHDHPIVKEQLTFVRQQDVNLATESCL